jgi:hypothetical protein
MLMGTQAGVSLRLTETVYAMSETLSETMTSMVYDERSPTALNQPAPKHLRHFECAPTGSFGKRSARA